MGDRGAGLMFLRAVELPTSDNYFDFTEEKHFKQQQEWLSNYLLLGDIPDISVHTYKPRVPSKNSTTMNWLNKGELIAGSFMAHKMNDDIPYSDIDIYFQSKDDAMEWMNINNISPWRFRVTSEDICGVVTPTTGKPFNLIWGIKFTSPETLLNRFDIRAISIAFDPNTSYTHYVQGAISDCRFKRLIFNPVPRATSINRLLKYSEKEFRISPKQRLFFAQLVQSSLYNPEIELSTGYEGHDSGTGY